MILYTVLWALVVLIADSRQSSETNETIEEADSLREFLEKSVEGKPTKDYKYSSANAWENSGKFEGDIVLTEGQIDGLVEQVVKGYSRNGFKDMRRRWPHNTVHHLIITEDFGELHTNTIKKAMTEIEDKSCIKFRNKTRNDKNYVVIQGSEPGCYSNVGFNGGKQIINLGMGCLDKELIVHELLHTLGFFHMHSHHKRDDFVTIEWDNIDESKKKNFIKYGPDVVTDFGVPYDYESILHYQRFAHSKNRKETMTSKTKTPVPKKNMWVNTSKMTSSDIKKLNLMYKCKDEKKSIKSPKNNKKRNSS